MCVGVLVGSACWCCLLVLFVIQCWCAVIQCRCVGVLLIQEKHLRLRYRLRISVKCVLVVRVCTPGACVCATVCDTVCGHECNWKLRHTLRKFSLVPQCYVKSIIVAPEECMLLSKAVRLSLPSFEGHGHGHGHRWFIKILKFHKGPAPTLSIRVINCVCSSSASKRYYTQSKAMS